MDLAGKIIGLALTGSHCTISEVYPQIKELILQGATVIPVFSESVQHTDTRFGTVQERKLQIIELTGREPLGTIAEVEQIGPRKMFDILVIAPCTGNTLAKMAHGITDSVVTMAAKAHLRNRRPLVIGLATNDGLGTNAANLGQLMNRKHVYFIPFGQDNPAEKTNSLVSDMRLLCDTVQHALDGEQLQPVLINHHC